MCLTWTKTTRRRRLPGWARQESLPATGRAVWRWAASFISKRTNIKQLSPWPKAAPISTFLVLVAFPEGLPFRFRWKCPEQFSLAKGCGISARIFLSVLAFSIGGSQQVSMVRHHLAVSSCRRLISNPRLRLSEFTSNATGVIARFIRRRVLYSTLLATFLIRHGAAAANIKPTRSLTTDFVKWRSVRFLPIASWPAPRTAVFRSTTFASLATTTTCAAIPPDSFRTAGCLRLRLSIASNGGSDWVWWPLAGSGGLGEGGVTFARTSFCRPAELVCDSPLIRKTTLTTA